MPQRATRVRFLAASLLVVAAATAGGADAASREQRLFARQDGCDSTYLDVRPGRSDAGCFFLLQPASEVFHALPESGPVRDAAGGRLEQTYRVRGSAARVLDPSRPARAHVEVQWLDTEAGVGLTTVDASLVLGDEVLVTATATKLATGEARTAFDLELAVPARLRGKALTGLALRTEIRGVNAPIAAVAHDGRTWVDLPLQAR